MGKTFTKFFFSFLFLSVFAAANVFAQSITIGNVDPGPYAPGSTITVPFHVNDASGCVGQANTFQLYMSDASGSFTSTVPVATVSGFYATFINYHLPAGIAPGSGYKFQIKATTPAISSGNSNAITISAGTGVQAGATSTSVNTANPEVYGTCSTGTDGTPYPFIAASSAGTTTVSFYNELTKSFEAQNINLSSSYTFNANAANYTVFVKAVNNGITGTYAYQLINSKVALSFGADSNPLVCLSNGPASVSFNVNVTGQSGGALSNYPGITYKINWGDGTSSNYTFCQLLPDGKVTHEYTNSSCGLTASGHPNSYRVDLVAVSPYCSETNGPSEYARVFKQPTNGFNHPLTACTNSVVQFDNTSQPGPDPNGSLSTCNDNPEALYTWLIDGDIKAQNVKLIEPFRWTFATSGTHTVTLRLQSNGSGCGADDKSYQICIQNAPVPNFDLAAGTVCLSDGPVTPIDRSTFDNGCTTNQYVWTVTGPAVVGYANGTSANSQTPQFTFSKAGVYSVSLSINSAGCGPVVGPAKRIVVNEAPVAKLSADFSVCGGNLTYTFDNTAGSPTRTTLTGTSLVQANTYQWTVTSAAGGTYSFVNGTAATSQYPQIHFDSFDTYTVSVTETNNCGTQTATQKITFAQAPTVFAGNPFQICQGDVATLNGSVTPANYNSLQWTGGTGTFTNGRSSLANGYTPSAAEIAAGQVTLTLDVATSLPAPCNDIKSQVTITIIPTDVVTSAPGKPICSGSPVGYNITGKNANSTFTWTAALTSGSATGFADGSGAAINDVLTSTNTAQDAVVTYIITPSSNGCTGTPFQFQVTIHALPVLTATPANAAICSGNPAAISLTSTITGTTYAWTATSSSNITGFTNQATPTSATSIQDVLVNSDRTISSVVHYIITPYNIDGCPGTPANVDITVEPAPVQAFAGNDKSLCNVTSYQLQGNDPSPGTGKWNVLAGSGVTFDDDTKPNATVSGLVPGSTYQFEWVISSASGCPPTHSQVNISDNLPTNPGTTTGSAEVCSNGSAGNVQLSGQVGAILHWESSTDNGATWQTIANQTATQPYNNLTITTQYRAVVQNGSCDILTSTISTITVNPTAPQADAGNYSPVCNATTVTLAGNNPGAFTGEWTQLPGSPAVVITDPSKYNTTVTGLTGGNVYTFRWTIKGTTPCPDTYSDASITDKADVVPSFTASTTEGCGDLTVTFTNTSNNQTGATFLWDFGDGSTSPEVNPQHTFAQTTDGTDAQYNVQLLVVSNCVDHPAFIQQITVHPAIPVPVIHPNATSGCSPFTLTVSNQSKGNNKYYVFRLYDGNTPVEISPEIMDKSDYTFRTLSPTVKTVYTLTMDAISDCGATASTTQEFITVSPPSFISDFQILDPTHSFLVNEGCDQLTVAFANHSTGGDQFTYTIYDANMQPVGTPIIGNTSYTPYSFPTAGTYFVQLTATNGCGSVPSPVYKVVVDPVPQVGFHRDDNSEGCGVLTVQFRNDSQSLPSNPVAYDWDFGDGSAHSPAYEPSHDYTSPGSYKVTLTVTYTGGMQCTSSLTKLDYVIVHDSPAASFTERPGAVTKIPNYHFAFIDQSTGGANSWLWDFGDNSTPSTAQNPEHTYADTGTYKVTLSVANSFGCPGSITGYVQITGTPGQLYLPNAFMPSSATDELHTFMAKGSGIATWHLQIFNNYGQLVWETTKLDAKGAPVEGWDGTYKGQPAPQGVYVWQASATFINGTQWKGMSYNNSAPKRTGTVNLIR